MPPQEEKTPQQPQPESPKPKITKMLFAKMLAVAIFFDVTLGAIQLIPVAGSIMEVFLTLFLLQFFLFGTK